MTNIEIVEQAYKGNYIGIPYETLDCQGLIKKIIRDCGEKHSAKGSNDMWRNWLSMAGQKGNIEIIPGMLVFTIKNDKGEQKRGYFDNLGNAAHVGLVLYDSKVIHSTAGGVQWSTILDKRWTHAGRMSFIEYLEKDNTGDISHLLECASEIYNYFNSLKG